MMKDFIKYKCIKLDKRRRKLFVNNKSVRLRNMEFLLIEYLIHNAERVLDRTQILESVWDRNIFCTTNTIDVHVSTLRKKLKRLTNRPLIHTIHCLGYMLEI
ncbi:hypothetical protein GF354_01190 [Candidatus Peregrinibacteria bacterium]|nr:hypothetical protein [Candidatus Peregrinibacteria bacterium]